MIRFAFFASFRHSGNFPEIIGSLFLGIRVLALDVVLTLGEKMRCLGVSVEWEFQFREPFFKNTQYFSSTSTSAKKRKNLRFLALD